MLIEKILQRYETEFKEEVDHMEDRIWQLREDLKNINQFVMKLNLKKLLEFDHFNFAHDVFQIPQKIDRDKGEFTGFFLPRCAEPKQ